ncbi:MAG: UTP--glucose-1-phosphate uridylyltransferase [Chloroflexi bacterium]|nr:UTP--glucose-1-phosphate uridylyltransferase [Chloroflexota bacterium]
MNVRKAVIPAAGFGTRFLPATRTIPKVMIPVLDRPTIHFAVEEAAEAGIEQVILVVSRDHRATGDYFDHIPALDAFLKERGNEKLLEEMNKISDMVETVSVYQDEQRGLGHAVLMAKDAVGDEPFAVFLPDDIIWSESPTIGSMIEVFSEYEAPVIAVKEVPDEAVPNLGIVDPRPVSELVSEIVAMVEKPKLEDAPSNLAIIGRYVLTPDVFDALEEIQPGAIGELQLTDAIDVVRRTRRAYAYRFPGTHFDVGVPAGLLKASVYAALHRDDMAEDFRKWLNETSLA